jgi:hypothetical protein
MVPHIVPKEHKGDIEHTTLYNVMNKVYPSRNISLSVKKEWGNSLV